MLFWTVAAALTAAAAVLVLWPALAGRAAAATGGSDAAVYRDQLAELGRDADAGLIGAAEAEEARAEIGRRLLRAAGDGAVPATGRDLRLLHFAAVIAVPVLAWGVYAAYGTPGLPSRPLAERLTANPASNTIDELVARAEAHLREKPDDIAGWEVVAPIYLRLGQPDKAADAWRRAIALAGPDAARLAGLGEALVQLANGTVTPEARDAFDQALALDGKLPRARFFVALAEAQAGRLNQARAGFQAIVADTDPASPWVGASRQALAQIDGAPEADAPGPTGAQVDDAAALSGEDRAAMIEGMVARLADRLKADPADLEGWKRLVRAYIVMNRADDARAALAQARTGLAAPAFAELETFARDNGLPPTE